MAYNYDPKRSVNKKDLDNQEKTKTAFSQKKKAAAPEKKENNSGARVQQQNQGNSAMR